MSLLLDARKKSQQAQSSRTEDGSHLEPGLEPHPGSTSIPLPPPASSPDSRARVTGQNLFNAKSHSSPTARTGIHRNLLIALGGTVLLLTAGAGYVWYIISPDNTQPQRPISMPAVEPLATPASATDSPHDNLIPDIASPEAVLPKPANTARPTHAAQPAPRARKNNPVLIEQHHDEPIDPLLNSAYLAYRSGKFEQAQHAYQEVLKLDERNTDALLGLAVIAQRHGEDNVAVHYYGRVLELDPRNAVANSGMSELTTGDNRESRLKDLLNEQQSSASLHFALGNLYAEQSRWAEAQQAYFNAYRLDPDNADLAFNLAISLDRLGQNQSAVQYYQRALELDSGDSTRFDHAQISQHIEDLTH